MTISLDGPLCGCGNYGCLEAYASGTGLVNRAHEALAAGHPIEPGGIWCGSRRHRHRAGSQGGG